MNAFMIIKDRDGIEKKCEIVSIFHKGKSAYVAYTLEDDGKIPKDLLVSKYIEEDRAFRLVSVETEEEWDFIREYLKNEVFERGCKDE